MQRELVDAERAPVDRIPSRERTPRRHERRSRHDGESDIERDAEHQAVMPSKNVPNFESTITKPWNRSRIHDSEPPAPRSGRWTLRTWKPPGATPSHATRAKPHEPLSAT